MTTTPPLPKLLSDFNRYFTSSNGVDAPERVSVSRDEWRVLFEALSQRGEAVGSVTVSHYKGLENRDVDYWGSLPDGTHLLFTAPQPAQPSEPIGWAVFTPDGGWAQYATEDAAKRVAARMNVSYSGYSYGPVFGAAQTAKPVPMKRPGCFDFALEFIGDPEASELRKYVEELESFHHIKEQPCAQSNREELLAEDIECLHRCLDDKGVPRSLNGDPLSMWGRVCWFVDAQRNQRELTTLDIPKEHLSLNVQHKDCHKAANAFWDYWKENGETHKHGYYESTWGAINRALRTVGVVENEYLKATAEAIDAAKNLKPKD